MSHAPVVPEKNTRPAVADSIITGFHAVEEYIRHIAGNIDRSDSGSAELLYCNPGPRVKKICVAASAAGISCTAVEKYVLDKLTSGLNGTARDHRGLVLKIAGGSAGTRCRIPVPEADREMRLPAILPARTGLPAIRQSAAIRLLLVY